MSVFKYFCYRLRQRLGLRYFLNDALSLDLSRARARGAPADACRILYGGSVKPDNVTGLMAQEEIDGALVGGASLDPASFASIVNY